MITLVSETYFRNGEDKNNRDPEELLPISSRGVYLGLIAVGTTPYNVETDGRVIVVNFIKEEASAAFQKVQASLVGAGKTPLMVPYNNIILADSSWKGYLTMMRSTKIQHN